MPGGHARLRAPPGGHARYCSPLRVLEPSTLQLFTTFHNFHHHQPQGQVPGGHARLRAPPGGHARDRTPGGSGTSRDRPFSRPQLARRPGDLLPTHTTARGSPRRFQRALPRPSTTLLARARALFPAENRPSPSSRRGGRSTSRTTPSIPPGLTRPGAPSGRPRPTPESRGPPPGTTSTRRSVGPLEPAFKHPSDGRYSEGTRGRRTARPWDYSVL